MKTTVFKSGIVWVVGRCSQRTAENASIRSVFLQTKIHHCWSIRPGTTFPQSPKQKQCAITLATWFVRKIQENGKYSHIIPALYDLHWLSVCLRIHLKILLLTFKVIYGLAPSYLSDMVNKSQKSSYNLRSNDNLLFHAAAPVLWNSPPSQIRDIQLLALFIKELKTHLFREAFLS